MCGAQKVVGAMQNALMLGAADWNASGGSTVMLGHVLSALTFSRCCLMKACWCTLMLSKAAVYPASALPPLGAAAPGTGGDGAPLVGGDAQSPLEWALVDAAATPAA
jgi:hypothetical protein